MRGSSIVEYEAENDFSLDVAKIPGCFAGAPIRTRGLIVLSGVCLHTEVG